MIITECNKMFIMWIRNNWWDTQTSLCIKSKQCVARESWIEKGRVLLFPSLQVEQSRIASLAKSFILLMIPKLNKCNKTFELGCPNFLCNSWTLFLEKQGNANDLSLGCADKQSGNKRLHLGPLMITFLDPWSCIIQLEEEKKTLQWLSTSWPIEIKFVDKPGERKIFFKGNESVISPMAVMESFPPSAVRTWSFPSYGWTLERF